MARLCEIREALENYSAGFDASLLSGDDAAAGLDDVLVIENIASYLTGALALRWAETEGWRKSGARSPEEELARKSGTTPGQAKDKLKTSKRTRTQPKVTDAARKGTLSPEQNSVISDAVAADPAAEDELVDEALSGASLGESRDSAGRVKSRACPDLEARRRKIHAERSLRAWTDADGVWNLKVTNNAEVGAQIMARLDALTDEIFHKSAGVREPRNRARPTRPTR